MIMMIEVDIVTKNHGASFMGLAIIGMLILRSLQSDAVGQVANAAKAVHLPKLLHL